MSWKRLSVVGGAALGLAVCGSLAARAQEAPSRRALDARSVLVAWTNEAAPEADFIAPEVEPEPLPEPEEEPAVDRWVRQANDFLKEGDYDRAIRAFDRALEADATNKMARFGKGTVLIRMADYAGAVEVLEPMTREYPEDYSLKNNLAWLYATAHDNAVRNSSKAIALAQDALLIAPKDYHVWSTLSEAYYVDGQYDRALRAAEEALDLARQFSASGANIVEYQRQVQKSRRAAKAMSVFE